MRYQPRTGFTMIELLMVITIVAILGATALPQFLDFRKEAKLAAAKQILASLRVSINNQLQAARLKCNADVNGIDGAGYSFFYYLSDPLYYNDITASFVDFVTFGLRSICTSDQIPNAADRQFWATPQNAAASSNFPENPLMVNSETGFNLPLGGVAGSTIDSNGGPCGTIQMFLTLDYHFHWLYNQTTGDIYIGTYTPDLNECNY